MDYLLKSSGLVVLLFLFYHVFLKKDTFFKSVRIYFLLGLITVVAMPLIEIPVYVEVVSKQINSFNIEQVSSIENNSEQIDWQLFLSIIYVIGVVLFSIKFIVQLASLSFLISKEKLIKKGKFYFIETSKNIAPFSFFSIIIYNKSHFLDRELTHILRHEKAHVLQWHSVDAILAHLLVIFLWFNPFVWMYKKAVQQNLEFLADEFALKHSENQKTYLNTLLKTCSSNYCTQITNNFYNSLIKKRIMMLHKTKSPNTKQWKYALIIPLLIAFIALFNTKTIAQEKGEWEIKTSIESVELIIDKDYSDALLQQEAETFKNEFNIDLSFKGIKRNTVNEITAIKIDAKGANIKTSFKKSGTDPINPILISFNNENNAISIGHLSEEFDGAGMYNKPTYSNQENENSSGQYIFIASDGDGNTWTSKSDTIVNAEKIIINKNGNKEIIWVEKKIDSSNANVQVIEINSENNADTIKVIKSGDKSFIIEEDNASENVFIIKNNDGTIEKKVIETKVVNSDANDKPLILVNGKETSSEEMKKINPNDIESINVLKGENALKKYGEKAKNGVIEITKKK